MKNFLFILLLFLFSSCVSSKQYAKYPATDVPVTKEVARIYVIRKSFMGLILKVKIYEEEQLIGKLGPKSHLCWDVKEGDLVLIGKTESKDTMTIPVKAGETYFIKQKLKVGILVGRPRLEIMDKEKAQKAIARTRKPKLKPIP